MWQRRQQLNHDDTFVDSERLGVRAFHEGQPDSFCPYPIAPATGNRAAWFRGYLAAGLVQRSLGKRWELTLGELLMPPERSRETNECGGEKRKKAI